MDFFFGSYWFLVDIGVGSIELLILVVQLLSLLIFNGQFYIYGYIVSFGQILKRFECEKGVKERLRRWGKENVSCIGTNMWKSKFNGKRRVESSGKVRVFGRGRQINGFCFFRWKEQFFFQFCFRISFVFLVVEIRQRQLL